MTDQLVLFFLLSGLNSFPRIVIYHFSYVFNFQRWRIFFQCLNKRLFGTLYDNTECAHYNTILSTLRIIAAIIAHLFLVIVIEFPHLWIFGDVELVVHPKARNAIKAENIIIIFAFFFCASDNVCFFITICCEEIKTP